MNVRGIKRERETHFSQSLPHCWLGHLWFLLHSLPSLLVVAIGNTRVIVVAVGNGLVIVT